MFNYNVSSFSLLLKRIKYYGINGKVIQARNMRNAPNLTVEI